MKSPQLDRVNGEQNSQEFPAKVGAALDGHDLTAEYEEMGVPRPDERLSEAFPDEFGIYCEQFIDVFPRSPYYVKTTYEPNSPYGGWPQKKSKKTGRPLPLVDNGNFLNRTDCVERHLDLDQWLLFRQTTDPFGNHRKLGDFYWLGQNKPKRTTFHCIDLDNKRFLGFYRLGSGSDAPWMPVVHMPLDHFKAMKRIYDHFPNRIWCITSETLGLDIIERHRLMRTALIHDRAKRQLTAIGLGDTEVHPMTGRCKRRPFGTHYRTITQEGVLETWQEQLAYFLNPGPTPSFQRICQTLWECLKDQWKSWLHFGDAVHRRVNTRAIVASHNQEMLKVQQWFQDGCPLTKPTQVTVSEDVPTNSPAATPDRPPTNKRAATTRSIPPFSLGDFRNGNWVKKLADIALHGLPCDDSLGPVAYEMAKFLWWIEFYDLPEDRRRKNVLGLLIQFIDQKHNGFITRWNDGHRKDVVKQLFRCIQLAERLDEDYRDQSLAVFASIRQKRDSQRYLKVISLEDLILSSPMSSVVHPKQDHGRRTAPAIGDNTSSSTSTSTPSSSTYFSVGTLTNEDLKALDVPLPKQLIEMMDKHRGRNRIHQYATRLCNILYRSEGVCRISYQRLNAILGYNDRKRVTRYNGILKKAGIIKMDHYVRGRRPCGYWLTAEARRIIDHERKKPDHEEA